MLSTKLFIFTSGVAAILFLVQGKVVLCGIFGVLATLGMILHELEKINEHLKKGK